jgi:N-acetylmuramate 1-kinase
MGVADASDSRLELLTRWVVDELGFAGCHIAPASADASFRRYFRVNRDSSSYIVMDAPPGKEDLGPFLNVGRILRDMGVNVPAVLARDVPRGFLLLSDLGTRQYLDELKAGGEDALYADALDALLKIQAAPLAQGQSLPRYDDAALKREMGLFPEWFVGRHLQAGLRDEERGMLNELFDFLSRAALAQPKVIVHRDYHSRNLLLTSARNPGIIDHQDAVVGPLTYDAVSLLKDCYIAWPRPRVRAWLAGYREALRALGCETGSEQQFLRAFDLMGLQRHIKVLGIFSRLYYRDGKPQYLLDLPRVFEYSREAAALYPETQPFARYLDGLSGAFNAAQSRIAA